MTERQAWTKLAKLWGDADYDDEEDCYFVHVGDNPCWGLCQSIEYLLGWEPKPTRVLVTTMLGKLPADKGYGFSRRYCWPNDKEGAEARAEFCRRMAAECKPAKRRKVAK
jgi:hypothetical protein